MGAGRRHDDGANDHFPRRLVCQPHEAGARRQIEERFATRGVEDACRERPAAAADPRQRAEQEDLVGPDVLDRLVHAWRRRGDSDRMEFAELPRGSELIEPRFHAVDSRLGHRKREYDSGHQHTKRGDLQRARTGRNPQPSDRLHETDQPDDSERESRVHNRRGQHAMLESATRWHAEANAASHRWTAFGTAYAMMLRQRR